METLAPPWDGDLGDPADLGGWRHEPWTGWGPQCVMQNSPALRPPPPAGMWMDQLSPHLQRNKQLQDTLLQREEELTRLQEENIKLREFLSSSFIRDLQQKAKELTADKRRKLKRSFNQKPLQVSKRVCRNLTAEFNSEYSDSSEPNLDLWVLQTLGLKDRDTIDTFSQSSSDCSPSTLVYPEYTLGSSFSPPGIRSTHTSQDYHQGLTPEVDGLKTDCDFPALGLRTPGELTAGSFNRLYETANGSYNTSPVLRTQTCPLPPASSLPVDNHMFWTPPEHSWTFSENISPFSPPSERLHSSPGLISNQEWTPVCSPTSPPAASRPPSTLQTPCSRSDLAFSMSLSPSSSVKTHSFPQGQAFTRKDVEGRWNFTWVPKQ